VIWNDLDEHDKALAAIEAARLDAAKSDWEEGVKACDEIKAEIYVKIGRNQEAISMFRSAGYKVHDTPSTLGETLVEEASVGVNTQ
jgi:tetratricopeptide (TPR) repeat protein